MDARGRADDSVRVGIAATDAVQRLVQGAGAFARSGATDGGLRSGLGGLVRR